MKFTIRLRLTKLIFNSADSLTNTLSATEQMKTHTNFTTHHYIQRSKFIMLTANKILLNCNWEFYNELLVSQFTHCTAWYKIRTRGKSVVHGCWSSWSLQVPKVWVITFIAHLTYSYNSVSTALRLIVNAIRITHFPGTPSTVKNWLVYISYRLLSVPIHTVSPQRPPADPEIPRTNSMAVTLVSTKSNAPISFSVPACCCCCAKIAMWLLAPSVVQTQR
jgi:hypothetical protein